MDSLTGHNKLMQRLPELTTHSYSAVPHKAFLWLYMTESKEKHVKPFASNVNAEATISLGALSKFPDCESTGHHIYTLSK